MSEIVELGQAVTEIQQAFEWSQGATTSPFFFMIGAGVSAPQVPLASSIVADLRKHYSTSNGASDRMSLSAEYSFLLSRVCPHPRMRQDYFRKLIEGKAISAANLRLAHLLLGEGSQPPLANLVVTTNFDNFLSRALRLFGKDHVLCDSPRTVPRVAPSNRELTIIHVHGTYQFYDIKNLSGEIKGAATISGETSATMASLLDAILWERSPIVVGYGGWEGDAFMASLHRRLKGGELPHALYWCCYDRDDVKDLPNWLRDDPSVRFVVADARRAPQTAAAAAARAASDTDTSPAAALLGAAQPLEARTVFDRLIRTLKVSPPRLTSNPIAFFLDQLSSNLPGDEHPAVDGDDPYRIRAAIAELSAAVGWVDTYRQQRSRAQQGLHEVSEHLRTAQYAEAIRAALEVTVGDLDAPECDELLGMGLQLIRSEEFSKGTPEQGLALFRRVEEIALRSTNPTSARERVNSVRYGLAAVLARVGQQKEAGVELGAYLQHAQTSADPEVRRIASQLLATVAGHAMTTDRDGALQLLKLSVDLNDSSDESSRKLAALSLLARGTILAELGDDIDAMKAFDEVIERFGNASESGIREHVAMALVNKGFRLGKLAQSDEELRIYDEVVRRFGDATDSGIKKQVAMALINKGFRLGKLAQRDEELRTYDEVIHRFGDATDSGIREQVAKALLNRGIVLGAQGQTDEELRTYDELVSRFGDATDNGIRALVGSALNNKVIQLGKRGRSDDQLRTYDEVVRLLEGSTDSGIREQVARALVNKGIQLDNLGRSDEGLRTYEEVIRRFGDSPENGIRELVANALLNKALQLGKTGRKDEELGSFRELVDRFGHSEQPELRSLVGQALNSIGFELLCRAKARWQPDGGQAFLAALGEAEAQLARALEYRPEEPVVLGNQGYIAFLQGRRDDARALLTRAIASGGDELRQGELADAEIHPLPMDDDFKRLVQSIPGAPVEPTKLGSEAKEPQIGHTGSVQSSAHIGGPPDVPNAGGQPMATRASVEG